MTAFLSALFWFVVTLGVLVTFHEFGHFWVARRCGVKVVRFSVGFGRALWSRKAKDGTEYQLAMLPLGGYVKMLDEREDEVAPTDRDAAFNRQHVLKRIAIVLAGPMANLILCVALLWSAYLIGVPELAPVVGQTRGIAADSGLREGDRILRVGDQATGSWDEVITPLFLAAVDRRALPLEVRDASGVVHQRRLALDRLPADFDQARLLEVMGLIPSAAQDGPTVGLVLDGSAARGVLLPGDVILSLNDQPIARFSAIKPLMQKFSAQGQPVRVVYRRGEAVAQATISPKLSEIEGKSVWLLGIGPVTHVQVTRYALLPALQAALQMTGIKTRETLGVLARLVSGKASPKNLSGAIGIAQAAKAEASGGAGRLLLFMASLSLMLCILNLLPIPVLDGGHLLYYLIELVSGRPVSESVMVAGQYAGLAVLAGLIILANFNDLLRSF